MQISDFIARWSASGAAERANKDLFLIDLCVALDVSPPEPSSGDTEKDVFTFERDALIAHPGGIASVGKIDLYKQECFILEAKQGSDVGAKKLGTAKRGTAAWNIAMRDAFGQALGYARTIEPPVPFLITCDIGYCFDLYASFDGSWDYRSFPSPQQSRIYFTDLPRHAETFRRIFLDPHTLDPSKISAAVTRDIAADLAELAKSLEASGHTPEDVARFLMRCIFTMFAEDAGLLPAGIFAEALRDRWLDEPSTFVEGAESLWRAMNDGSSFGFVGKLLKFNGGLFVDPRALPLDKVQLALLARAASRNWAEVEPAIFGTLLERALDPRERHRIGAHFTPRPYVERLVKPTIEEPLRAEWAIVQAEVRQHVAGQRLEVAKARLRDFLGRLSNIRVLDPACGSGNFLYVTLAILKQLEAEVHALLGDLGVRQHLLDYYDLGITPAQFLGIEIKEWAKEIADLVLWIGYLQWHLRTWGASTMPPEPVLRNYGNIECRDALVSYSVALPVLDESGAPVTRWDGETLKYDSLTGEKVPDETVRVPVLKYVDAAMAPWPRADFIVGNPPFIGNWRMRLALGDGYVDALRAAHPDMPETSDFVMFWWNRAASLVKDDAVQRFGFITTNSIWQQLNRKVVERAIGDPKHPASIVFAVPDHPWVDSETGADVRIAMTVVQKGIEVGTLARVVSEEPGNNGEMQVVLSARLGTIHADLKIGANIAGTRRLAANAQLSCPGVKLHGSGFIVTESQARQLGYGRIAGLSQHVRPYRNGRDMTGHSRDKYVIDLFGLSVEEVRERFPEVFQWVWDRVKVERDHNPRESYRRLWWIFGEPRSELRPLLERIDRYIATVETAKHRVFVFMPADVLPDNKIIAIASDDAFHLGILSSRVHLAWASPEGAGGLLEDRPVYVKSACFEKFPFPICAVTLQERIRAEAETLDVHRKRQLRLFPDLTLTDIYNVLQAERENRLLDERERLIHERGLVSVLRGIHDELDSLVLEAYGWQPAVTDDEIRSSIVDLNLVRAAEEDAGVVRWLRPDVQESTRERQLEMPSVGGKAVIGDTSRSVWPRELSDQVVAVRDLLISQPRALTTEDVARQFKKTRRPEVERALESLAALGLIVRHANVETGGLWQRAAVATA